MQWKEAHTKRFTPRFAKILHAYISFPIVHYAFYPPLAYFDFALETKNSQLTRTSHITEALIINLCGHCETKDLLSPNGFVGMF